MPDQSAALRKELVFQLNGGYAHASFDEVLANFPPEKRGTVPPGLPYSAWQLLEHMRLAQADILAFCRNHDGSYKEPKFPEGYWPKGPQPSSEAAWDDSIAQFTSDRKALADYLSEGKNDLFAVFPWGSGQTLLREALVVVDHNSYHLGEILALRRILNIWPK